MASRITLAALVLGCGVPLAASALAGAALRTEPPPASTGRARRGEAADPYAILSRAGAASGAGPAYLPALHAPTGRPTLRLVEQMGGTNAAVAAADTHVYLGAGPKVEVLDVSDPTAPVVMGRSAVLDGLVTAMDVADDGRLLIVLLNPQEWQKPTFDATRLAVLDVGQPSAPILLGQYSWPFVARQADLQVAGDRAYVAAGVHGLRIVDIGSAAAPMEVGSFLWPYEARDPWGFARIEYEAATCLCVVDDHAFVGGTDGRTSSWLRVVDVSDPTLPTQVGEIGGWATPPSSVAVWSGHAYMSVGGHGLHVVDVSDRTAPRAVSDVHVPPGSQWSYNARRVRTSDGMAYAVFGGRSDWLSHLSVFDLSDPAAPRLLGSVEVPHGPIDAAVAGGAAHVVSCELGLATIDITAAASPRLVARHHPIGSVYDVETESGLAYAGAADHGLRVIDLRSPGPPHEIAALDLDLDDDMMSIGGQRLAARDATAYVLGSEPWRAYSTDFLLVDVSAPTRPVVVGSVLNDGTIGPVFDRGIAIADGFFNDAATTEIYTIDVRRPASPRIVAQHPVDRYWLTAIRAAPPYLFLGGDPPLEILDVSDPAAPVTVGTLSALDEDLELVSDVHVAGGLAYASASKDRGSAYLQVIDVSDPTTPRSLGRYEGAGDTLHVVGTITGDDTIYWAQADLYVVDVSDPWHPRGAGIYRTPGYARDVAVWDKYVVVADWEGGLLVYELVEGGRGGE